MKRSKQQKRNIFLVILGFFIVLVNLLAFGLSVGYGAIKTKVGSDFSKSYNIRYEFDPYSKCDDPRLGYYTKDERTLSEVQDEMDDISKAYSDILLDNGTPADGVYSEVFQDENGFIKAFLNVTIPITQVERTSYPTKRDDKIDIAPATAYFSNVQSSNFSLVYCDGYTASSEEPENANADVNTFNQAKLYSWNLFEDDTDVGGLVDNVNKITNKNDTEIDIELKDGYSFGAKKSEEEEETEYFDNSVKATFKKAKDDAESGNEEGTESYPFIYIFHNLRGLINECEYYINVYGLYNNQPIKEDSPIYNAYWQMTQEQKDFAKYIWDNSDDFLIKDKTNHFSALAPYTFQGEQAGYQAGAYDKVDKTKMVNSTSSSNEKNDGFYLNDNNFHGSSIFRLIQPCNTETKEPEPGKTSDVNSSYSFINKYIVGIITKDNFLDYLPDDNPTKTDVDSDGEWLVIKPTTTQYYTVGQLQKQMTSQRFSMPMMSISYAGNGQEGYIPYTAGNKEGISRFQLDGVTGFSGGMPDMTDDANVAVIDNSLGKSAVGISEPAVTSIICLAVIILIIGIIVSILYRIPGFVMWVTSLTPVALVFLILGICGQPFSLAVVLSGLLTFVASTIASIFILNKMKRNHLSHKTMDQVVYNAYAKSFFICLDVFVVLLLLGIAPIFFTGTSILPFGLGSIIGALLGFVFIYFMSWLINTVIFNNGMMMYKNNWLSGVKTHLNEPINPDYKTEFDAQMGKFQPLGFNNEGYVSRIKTPFKYTFSKWSNVITWAIIGTVVIIGLALFFTIGIPKSTSFYGGTRLLILVDDKTNVDSLINALNNSGISGWYNGIGGSLNHYYYIETTGVYTYSQISAVLTAAGFNGFISVQSIDPSLANDLSLKALYVVLIFIGFMLVYGLIRFNWMCIVPNLAVGVVGVILPYAIAVIVRMPIDTNVMYGGFMTLAFMYMTMYGLLGSMFPKWVRKLHPVYNDLTFLMNYGITVFNDNKIFIYILAGTIIVPAILFMPISTLPMIGIFGFGVVGSAILINHCWPVLMRFFVEIQNNSQNRIKRIQGGIEKLNLDKVDEELINGININTKEIE